MYKRRLIRLMFILNLVVLTSLSNIPIARCAQTKPNVKVLDGKILMETNYFKYLKTKEMKYDELSNAYEIDKLKCKQQNQSCGKSLIPNTFSYIFFSGVVAGILGAYLTK